MRTISGKYPPLGNKDIVQHCLHNGRVNEILGFSLVAYRIKWHNYKRLKWSIWFIPGINDFYQKDGEPKRRYIACFNDHDYEVIGW